MNNSKLMAIAAFFGVTVQQLQRLSDNVLAEMEEAWDNEATMEWHHPKSLHHLGYALFTTQ